MSADVGVSLGWRPATGTSVLPPPVPAVSPDVDGDSLDAGRLADGAASGVAAGGLGWLPASPTGAGDAAGGDASPDVADDRRGPWMPSV